MRRKERWIAASGNSEDAARATITMQLGNFKPAENYSGDYVDSKTFTYGVDFKLGDFITYSGKAGTGITQVIGFTQTLSANVYTRLLLFGSNLSEIVRAIQQINGGK